MGQLLDAGPAMVRRECDVAGHRAWISVGITECPECTGHKRTMTQEERERIEKAWIMPRGGVDGRQYWSASGRWAMRFAGAR